MHVTTHIAVVCMYVQYIQTSPKSLFIVITLTHDPLTLLAVDGDELQESFFKHEHGQDCRQQMNFVYFVCIY